MYVYVVIGHKAGNTAQVLGVYTKPDVAAARESFWLEHAKVVADIHGGDDPEAFDLVEVRPVDLDGGVSP